MAALIGFVLGEFVLGAGGGHIDQIMTIGNHAAGNPGLVLWMEFVIPLAGLFFRAIARWCACRGAAP